MHRSAWIPYLPALLLAGALVMPRAEHLRNLERSTLRSQHVENAYTVRAAAERAAEFNEGSYPNRAGVVAHLPSGQPLRNSFDDARDQPIDGAGPSDGDIGYVVVSQSGRNIGYTIDLIDRGTVQVLMLRNLIGK